jgi:hypothetical protein
MATVTWIKSTAKEWLTLETFDISGVATVGVYIIWHGGQNPRVVYVGQGDVKARLTAHRGDRRILAYRTSGLLMVTWAEVSLAADRNGIERYLANRLSPLVGDSHPDVNPIEVNLPWAA